MIDIRCPCGCPGYLVKEFSGDYIELKCPHCKRTITIASSGTDALARKLFSVIENMGVLTKPNSGVK